MSMRYVDMNIENDHEKKEMLIPISDGTENEKPEDAEVEKDNDYIGHLQRLQAEFMNYKKRVEKERDELSSYAKGQLVVQLLPVLDDFERMLQHYGAKGYVNTDEVQLIFQNLRKVLTGQGLEEIDASEQTFDPQIHEAVSAEETDPSMNGKVLEVWRKGYRFGGKLLRPSQVKVAKQARRDG